MMIYSSVIFLYLGAGVVSGAANDTNPCSTNLPKSVPSIPEID